MDLKKMSAYELGETNSKEAIPHLKNYLNSLKRKDLKLAASAIGKLWYSYPKECQRLKDDLMKIALIEEKQVLQYILKTLSLMTLNHDDLINLSLLYSTSLEDYNVKILRKICYKYGIEL